MKKELTLQEDFEVVQITKGDMTISLTFTQDDYADRDKVEIKVVTKSEKDRGIFIKPSSNNKIELILDKGYDDYIRAVERTTKEKYRF